MKFKANIIVTLKSGVKDPKGEALSTVLARVGYEKNANAKVGKFFVLNIEAADKDLAKERLETICNEALINPVLEDFVVQSLERVE